MKVTTLEELGPCKSATFYEVVCPSCGYSTTSIWPNAVLILERRECIVCSKDPHAIPFKLEVSGIGFMTLDEFNEKFGGHQ
jgi:hypothetical protein